ncbi:xanthine dehydrogenase accessory factor [Microbacterium sp. cf046]|uniref:XdhC family protein n=1 Tax=Microbacterium sp. cf046 TaxID=1761803 RepID=UPI0008E93F02|nr:XdhC/CoxI family protein [Microbacterium sp. cf046]SFR89244.1 xanthine dehydrogenase accessory factor [Microbacterium sp. cf046]
MLELAADLLPRLRAGEQVAVVTVTRVARSAPRGAGASMAVTATGEVIGSISGGCVEEDAVMLALRALAGHEGLRASFGFSDADAHAAGLACGGAIDVVAYPVSVDDVLAVEALEAALRDEVVAVGLVVEHRGGTAPLGRIVPIAIDGQGLGILTLTHTPRPRLVILGAGDYAAALCRVASVSGFAVTVCDGWGLLVTAERFPDADTLVTRLPHEFLRDEAARLDPRTSICVLTHDERHDVPALREALRLPVAFVGALGARTTVARRARLLREQGVSDAQLARLHSPLGLDLGAQSPEETAISILAEIIATHRAGSGAPLRELSTPIHGGDSRPADAVGGNSCVASPAGSRMIGEGA